MFRKLLAFIILVALAAAVWYGTRWRAARGDLHATVIFQSAEPLKKGSPITEGQAVIGSVTKVSHLEGQDAVSIRVGKAWRGRILSDSLFSVELGGKAARLDVINGIAVGAPVKDGSILYAREDRLARWLAKRGDAVAPIMRQIGARASQFARDHDLDRFDDQLSDWKAKFPEWSKEGEQSVNRNLAAIRQKADALEKKLRDEKRDAEADRVRREIDAWLAEVTKSKSD